MTTIVSIVGENITDTEDVREALFPDEKYTVDGAKRYHWFKTKGPVGDAEASAIRMRRLKTGSSECSSMDTDSLPEYEDLYPDDGDNDTRTRSLSADQDGSPQQKGQRLQRIKAVDDDYPISTSLPSTSSSFSDTGAWVSQTHQDSSLSINCDVYEVPWDRDKGIMWALNPNAHCEFVVIVNLDTFNNGQDQLANYLDMIRAIDDMMEYKGFQQIIYVIGWSLGSTKCPKDVYRKAFRKLTEELERPTCEIRECGVLVNNSSMEDHEEFRRCFNDRVLSNVNDSIQNTSSTGIPIEQFRACAMLTQIKGNCIKENDISAILQKYETMNNINIFEMLESSNIIVKVIPATSIRKRPVSVSNTKIIYYICSFNLQYSHIDPLKQTCVDFIKTHLIRYKIHDRQLPTFIFVQICIHLIRKYSWLPTMAHGEYQIFQTHACFKVGKNKASSPKIILSTDTCYLYFAITQYNRTETSDPTNCALIRSELEKAIQDVLRNKDPCRQLSDCELSCQIRCNNSSKGVHDASGWIEVEDLQEMQRNCDKGVCDQCDGSPHEIVPSTLLNLWFTEPCEDMSTDNELQTHSSMHAQADEPHNTPSAKLTDSVLPKIAKCFGRGWQLFFVEIGLDHETIDQIIADHSGGSVEQVNHCLHRFKLMLEANGKQLTPTFLVDKLRQNKSVMVDVEKIKRILVDEGFFVQ